MDRETDVRTDRQQMLCFATMGGQKVFTGNENERKTEDNVV